VYRYVRITRHVRRTAIAAVLSLAVLGTAAADAGAKVLPYRLDVSPTTSSVGQPVTITVQTDPANDLGSSFDFEIAVYPASRLDEPGWPPPRAKPARRVVMTRTSDAHVYEGAFTPTRRGHYVVVGMSGLPDPVPITVTGRGK
jgi:hypothetical protein